jgi:putative transposase
MVLNEAMKLERAEALKAQPYERTDDRSEYANEFKDKTVPLTKGKVLLKVTQVRGGLEKGI